MTSQRLERLQGGERLDRFGGPIVILTIVVLFSALSIIARPVPTLFDNPLVDDSYYVLSVARQIGLGHGVTYDGTTLTNGFQPLWVFLCVPLFWLSDGDRVDGIRYVLGLNWVLYALGAFLAAALAERVVGKLSDRPRSAGIIAALVFSASPFIWRNNFNGLETSLAIVCLLAVLLCYVSIDLRNRLHLAGCGILLGILVLARIDSVFFVVALTTIQLLRTNSGWRDRIVAALCLAGPAVLVSSPWWAFNVIAFGHLTPSSGIALQDWAPTRSRYMASAGALIRALAPMFDFAAFETWPRAFLRAPIIGVAIWWTWPELKLLFRTLDRPVTEILSALALFVAALAVWYPTSSSALFFYWRYLAPASLVGVLFWTLVVLKIAASVNRTLVITGLALIAAQVPILTAISFSTGDQTALSDQVPLVAAHVPPGDVVGAFQSGTLGFMRDRVVNLDGRVNIEAWHRRHDIERYLRENGIRWIADWPWLVRDHLGANPAGWTPVASKDAHTLFRYDGPAGDAQKKP